ncbi:baculoviral IAP repeat-containing protein 2-like [Ostrea edulis]|uniref:baculoviral IAP repeat-containing protein 2-like n=1 Tax=Ostrea edulis TaxID=37623 RepID=UPI002094C677|nr:baculoviral IAP repeat-containing protein 2-like [Ostrea edulis]XP_048769387.1 baculoviral IAP repeat-containing protein 2-like [Ostrea edulis]
MDGIYRSGRISSPQQVSISPPGLQVPVPRDSWGGTAVQVSEDDNERSNCEYFSLRKDSSPVCVPSDDVYTDSHQSSLFSSHISTCSENDLEHDGETQTYVSSAPSSHSSLSSFSSLSTDFLSSLSSIPQSRPSRMPSLASVTEADSVNDNMLFTDSNSSPPITAQNPAPTLDFSDCRYPQYAEEQSRLNSFKDWPSHLTQTSHQMSFAGFYYTSFSDWVRCFCCGIGVRNWAPTDDPWVEHARWSPRCSYIRLMRDSRFLDDVEYAVQEREQEVITPPNVPLSIPSRITENISDVRPSTDQATEKYPDKTLEKNPLLTDAAQAVLKMGFLPKQVKRAVDIVLQKKTWRTMTAMEVVDVLTELEQESDDSTNSQEAETPDEHKPEDVEKLKETNENLRERTICKMCCTGKVSIVFLPCGHLVSCGQCSPALRKCPMCRQDIKGTVRVKFN